MIIEHMEVDFILSRLFNQRKIRFLDIGAHTGEFLKIFENTNHRHKYEVFSVEPLFRNLRLLRVRSFFFWLKGKGQVTVIPYGVGQNGVTSFYLGDSSTLFTSNLEWKQRFASQFNNSREISVQTRDFVSLIEKYPKLAKLPFDIVKIDTEGSDLNVLKLLKLSKMDVKAVIVEYNSNSISKIIEELLDFEITEIFIYVRDGIYTTYIGNYLNDDHLKKLVETKHNLSGNIVGFKSVKVGIV